MKRVDIGRHFLFGILFLFILLSLNFISAESINDALHLNIQTTSGSSIITGTFDFEFNISTTSDCANVVYNNSATLTTDSRGIVSYYLNNTNLNYTDQYWLCEYRNGVLQNGKRIGNVPYSFYAKNVSAEGIIADSNLDLSGKNITADLINANWNGSSLYAKNTTKSIQSLINDTTMYFKRMGIGIISSPLYLLNVNGSSYFGGSIFQTGGMNILNQIIHKGVTENFAGNNGLGQSSETWNSWLNDSSSWETIYTYYGAFGDAQFSGGVWTGKYLYMIPSYSDQIVKVNPATNKFTNISFDNLDYAYYGGCYDGRNVWMAQAASPNILKLDTTDDSITYISYNKSFNYLDGVKFSGCAFIRDKVFFIPEENDYLISVNVKNNSLTEYTNVNISDTYGDIAFNGGLVFGDKIWMIPFQSPSVVAFNPDTMGLENYTHGHKVSAYVGGCSDGERIWLAPAKSTTIDALNPATGVFYKYPYDRELIAPGESATTGCSFDGVSVWFSPTALEYGIKLDPNTGNYSKYYFNFEDGGYRGVVFTGKHLFFIPFQAQNITKIRPPEFGVDSDYTSGNLNVGENLNVGGNASVKEEFYIGGHAEFGSIVYVDDTGGFARISSTSDGGYLLFADSDNDATDTNTAFRIYSNAGSIGGGIISFQVLQSGRVFFGDLTATGGDPVCWDGSGGSYVGDCSSLTELKRDIHNISISENLWNQYMKLNPVTYFWKNTDWEQNKQVGFLAEEIEAVNPILADYKELRNEQTNETVTELSGINFNAVTTANVLMIQDLKRENEMLKSELCLKDNTYSWC